MLAILCVGASVVGIACGSDDEPQGDKPPTAEVPGVRHLVTDEDIAATRDNSPERAVLRWFQAVQFKDREGVQELVTDRALRDVTSSRLDRAVDIVGSSLGKPEITSVRTRGPNTSVRVLVLSYEAGKPQPVAASPVTFSVHEVANRWRIDNLDYLLASAKSIEAAREDGSS